MKKVEFFSETDLKLLKKRVNSWLSSHKLVQVIETNLCVVSHPHLQPPSSEYTFYILYNTANEEAKAIEELMEQQAIPAVAPGILSSELPAGAPLTNLPANITEDTVN